ncbi:hypothetical protein ACUSIJ_24400 [Pseudochelatococcus sp. B33]
MLKPSIEGQETPYMPAGPFKVRLPFVHYRIEWPNYFQGLLMCAVDLSAIPLMTELLGMPFEVALAVVILNGLLYLTHHLLGDPLVPGWITPAVPLIMAYCATFPEGPERVHALISFQMLLGAFAILIGITGMAHRVIQAIPQAIKSGIIIGAGFSAVISVFKIGGNFDQFPFTISIAIGLCFHLMFSLSFARLSRGEEPWSFIGNLDVLPCILLAVIIAPIFGEAPGRRWSGKSRLQTSGRSGATIRSSGLVSRRSSMFLTALPTALAAYIVLFGDVLKTRAILDDVQKKRLDEKIDYNPDCAHIILGSRNVAMSFLGPDVTMCGPIWAAMHVVICERFAKGQKFMRSLFGGLGSFRWGTNTGLLLMPIVTLVQPILGVALTLTLMVQGYVSVRIGVMEARSQRDLGIAGVTGAVLATRGAAWAFATGVILCLLIYGRQFFTGETDDTFVKDYYSAADLLDSDDPEPTGGKPGAVSVIQEQLPDETIG